MTVRSPDELDGTSGRLSSNVAKAIPDDPWADAAGAFMSGHVYMERGVYKDIVNGTTGLVKDIPED